MGPSLPLVEPLQRALYLRSLDLFGDLPARDLAVFAQAMREQWLRRGEVLYHARQPVRAVHLLVEGRVRVEHGNGTRLLESPEGVGMVELLAGTEADARAVAETNVLTLAIDASDFFDVIEDQFSMFLEIREALGRQIRALQRASRDLAGGEEAAPGRAATQVSASQPRPRPGLELVEQLIRLQSRPELHRFGVGVLADLIRGGAEMRVAAGDVLWEEESPPEYFALVVDGVVACGRGQDGVTWSAGPDTLVGLEAAFTGMAHAHAARAETDVRALRLEVPLLLDLAEDHFHAAAGILSHCARELLRLQRRAAATAPGGEPRTERA